MASKGNTIAQLDIGKIIRRVMFEKGMNKARMARKIGRTGPVIKKIIYNSSIQTYLVWEMSVALGHNFFTDLAQQLDAATEGKLEKQTSELDELKQEYARLKEERDYLRKAMDLLSK
jgi:plasmid maintenance system antidote protein VapI